MKTSRTRRLPPFYTQISGSLPRPGAVRVLLAQKYSLPARDYHAMDDMVRFAIWPQEVASLDVVSHGEWRRPDYVGEFLQRIGGFEKVRPYRHAGEATLAYVVGRRIRTALPVSNKDAEFLVRPTTRLSKFAPPSPLLIAIRYWHPDFSRDSYPVIQYLSRILRREADADNTLVVFTSDHGEGLGEHRSDRKYFRFEAAIKVPLVFAWPGCIIEGVMERTTLASGIDLVSTLCAYAGVAPPPLTSVQNLRPALEGHVARNVRRFLPVAMSVRAAGRVVRSERSKYAVFAGEAVEELFDLQLAPVKRATWCANSRTKRSGVNTGPPWASGSGCSSRRVVPRGAVFSERLARPPMGIAGNPKTFDPFPHEYPPCPRLRPRPCSVGTLRLRRRYRAH